MKNGFNLIEITLILAMMGILLSLVMGPATRGLDRLRVSNATSATASFYSSARFGAQLRGSRVRIVFRADTLQAYYEEQQDSLFLSRQGPSRRGVNMVASRNVIRVHPNGMGWGGANTKLVFWRGEAAESLTTSRLGRMRRWR